MNFDLAMRYLSKRGSPIRVILAPGLYDVSGRNPIELSGDTRYPLTIEGAGKASVISGDYAPSSERGRALFVLKRDKVQLRDFAVRNVGAFLVVGKKAHARDVRIAGIDIQDVHDGIVIDRKIDAIAEDWLIENVRIAAHVRVGIRLSGAATSRITIRNTQIDGASQHRVNNCFKGGIQLFERVHDVRIEDVMVANNVGCEENEYQQGDGIEADDKQGAPRRITLRRVRAIGNRDGNFDLKAEDMTLEDLVSEQDGATRHGFRFWKYRYTCTRCSHKGGGSPLQSLNAEIVLSEFMPGEERLRVRCNDSSKRSPTRIVERRSGGAETPLECAR
jgi:hypothetical protein